MSKVIPESLSVKTGAHYEYAGDGDGEDQGKVTKRGSFKQVENLGDDFLSVSQPYPLTQKKNWTLK